MQFLDRVLTWDTRGQSGLSYAGMTQIRFKEYFSAAGGGTSSRANYGASAFSCGGKRRGFCCNERMFSDAIFFKERFRTIERVFAWEDKFRRVLFRYEVISAVHYAFKTLAYTMINLRHFCRS